MSYIRSVREINNDPRTSFVKGEETVDNSWRFVSPEDDDPDGTLQIQRREPLVATDIDLTDAFWPAIEADSQWTKTNQYFASVLTDNRTNMNLPRGIEGDMTGRVISWNGQSWRSSPDEWFTRQTFESNNAFFKHPFTFTEGDGTPTVSMEDLGILAEGAFTRAFQMRWHPQTLIKWDGDRIGAGRTVAIQDESDFPDLDINDQIPLDRFRHYFIDDNVTVEHSFVLPNGAPVEFSSDNFNNNDLRCRIGTDTLFNGADAGGLIIRDLGIEDRDGGVATAFDVVQSGSEDFARIILSNTTVIEFATIGLIKGFNTVRIKDNRPAIYNEGLTLEDCDIISSEGNEYLGLLEGGAIDLTIKGTNGTMNMNAEIWSSDDNAIAMNIDSASTINQGTVTNSTYAFPTGGTFFASGSKDQTDPSWRFEVNGELADSNIISSAGFNGNVTETVIAAVNTPVAVAGVTVAGPLERFDHDPSGILTYRGTRDITLRVEMRASLEVRPDLETTDVAFCVFKNGVAQTSTIDERNIASVFQIPTSPKFVAVDNVDVSPGDALQMFVENKTDDENILITDLKLIIGGR